MNSPKISPEAPELSVVIPAYNEAGTIGRMLLGVTRALPETSKQIVIVDDHSSDGTTEWLRRNLAQAEGPWRSMSIDDDGEVRLSVDGSQNSGGFSFTVLF